MQAEYHAFRGTPADVAAGLYNLPGEVVAGVFYALLIQTDGAAAIHAFTRAHPGDREGSVAIWQGSRLDALPELLLTALLSTEGQGLHRKVSDLLAHHGELTDLGTVPCPPTPRGAFGHPIRPYAASPLLQAVVLAL